MTDLRFIEYTRDMLERGMQPDSLPVTTWRGDEIPDEIRQSVFDENLLELSGVYGDKHAGDPVEYDRLRLQVGDRDVEIVVWNRGITLFTTNDEKVVRIHRVMSKLMDAAESATE
jgi:hypothetical protein